MAKKVDHIHKYMRVLWGAKKTVIFRCMLPGCSHYVHEEMARNRKSLCWKCGNPFVMTLEKMRRIKANCDICQSGDKNPLVSKLDDLLGGL